MPDKNKKVEALQLSAEIERFNIFGLDFFKRVMDDIYMQSVLLFCVLGERMARRMKLLMCAFLMVCLTEGYNIRILFHFLTNTS